MKITYQAMIKESEDGMFVIFPDMEEAFERAAAALGKRLVISFEPAEDSKGSSVA